MNRENKKINKKTDKTSTLELLTLAQLNFKVGDVKGNLAKITDAYKNICNKQTLLICSELSLTGYYPQDLLSREPFLEKQDNALDTLIKLTVGKHAGIIIGFAARNTASSGKKLFNALALISDGKIQFEYHKRLLATYNVFDEARHFESGRNTAVFEYKNKKIGFLICEDAWANTKDLNYKEDPVSQLKNQSLDLIISINASPNNLGKWQERHSIIKSITHQISCPVIYLNQVGGNDELVFDGSSFVMNSKGAIYLQMNAFNEQVSSILITDINDIKASLILQPSPTMSEHEMMLQQVVLGIRDYVRKCGFSQVVIGSSGGIDSAVTLAICVEALGSDNVTAITMPSNFSSIGSVTDSETLCKNLGIKLLEAPIAEEFNLSLKRFEAMAGEKPSSLTMENIQARIRGRILMEYSNHFAALVISTGNKSEMSVGYATLYGDMNGGINPLGDLYKMEVYALAKLFNERKNRTIVPISIIEKEPSAELSEEQKDSDSLPEYPLLDAILKLYIEGDLLNDIEKNRCETIIKAFGITNKEINNIHRMVDKAEFKRKQAPPIIRVQKRSFGMGRWLPVAAEY